MARTEHRAIFQHCVTVFDKMAANAYERDVNGEMLTVWEGFLTHLFNDLNLSVPHYTAVMTELKRMDCVRQLRRGGGPSKSQWLILQRPSPILFEKMPSSGAPFGTNKWIREERIWQAIRDLAKRIDALEGHVPGDDELDEDLTDVVSYVQDNDDEEGNE